MNRTPHIIEVDADSKSPLLINGFYTGIFELQNEPDKKSGKSPVDEFIYAERLRLNSDFVPNIKLPDGVDKEDVRMEIEVNNLKEALKHYGTALEGLGNLRENVRKNYSENFLEFCQEQRLSDLETNDVVLGILKNNNEVRNYFTNKQNIESLVEKLKVGEQIEEETVNKNIRNEVTKILINDKIKEMLLSKPDNYDLKAKIFDILPNINLLKGFEIKKEVKGKESENFLECLDDYIELVVDRREQLMNRLSHVIDVEHLIFRDVDVKIDNLKSEITKNESIKSKLEDKVKKLEIRRKRIIKYHSKLDKLRLNGKEINNYWRRMVIEERNRKKLPNRSVVGR